MATMDYLGGKSGIQYNGIEVEEDTTGIDLQNVLLVGEFKRGPFNRPFKVTKETMEAKLSFDYNNPYYTFLEDAFEHGAEYIWVMRVSREQVVEPEPIWGDWILNSGVTVNTNGIAHYTAYKTNQREYYDSYANLDLTAAIVRSLHDADMQQWQAVNDAANELTGVTDWTFDNTGNQVVYYVDPSQPTNCQTDSCKGQYIWYINPTLTNGNRIYYSSPSQSVAISLYRSYMLSDGSYKTADVTITGTQNPDPDNVIYTHSTVVTSNYGSNIFHGSLAFSRVQNPNYDSNAEERERKTIPFSIIAQKIISNTALSNQAISLLAEAYLEAVAISIFNTESSKQFVKLLDIEPDFEANKTQR